jgi:hypothetical protein
LVAAVIAAAAAALWLYRALTQVPPVGESGTKPAAEVMTTGNYSQDWMDSCAKLTGQAQAECTKNLDAAYGKADSAPVPSAKDR